MTFLGVLVLPALVWMSLNVSSSAIAVFWDSISSREAVFSLQFTVVLALATTVINGALGTVVALLLVRHDFPLRGFIDSVIDLPIAIPASVTAFTLLLLYGPLGMVGRAFEGEGTKMMVAFSGLLIAHVFMTLPFVVREVGPPIRLVDRSQEEAARTLGANDAQIFGIVILPAIKGGLVAGCLFTFARSLGEFGATIMVTGNLALRTQTAPLYIFSEFDKGNLEAANAMSVVLVSISFVLFIGFKVPYPRHGNREADECQAPYLLPRIHRRTSLGTALEEASGCSSESGIMVLEQKPARKQGAPNRCCHRTNPTVSASSLTTIAWWPMPACSCRPP